MQLEVSRKYNTVWDLKKHYKIQLKRIQNALNKNKIVVPMVYFLVLVVFVKVLVVFSEIGVVLVVFGSGGSETLNPTLIIIIDI